jgi:hypothetical protein
VASNGQAEDDGRALGTHRGFTLWAYEQASGWLGFAVQEGRGSPRDRRHGAAVVAWCGSLDGLRDELVRRLDERHEPELVTVLQPQMQRRD